MSPRPRQDARSAPWSFIEAHSPAGPQRRLLHSLLGHFPAGESSPYAEIPLLVHGGITGREEEALPLTALGQFLYLGLDISDDVADGDAGDRWPGYSVWELQLASSLFVSALPQILLAELNTSADIRRKIQRRFANGLLELAAGQQMEFRMTGKPAVRPQDVEESVRGKSSGVATLASLAALLAGAKPDRINAYEDMGRGLGTAAQLATDFHDLFRAPASRDLRNGTRTLPIALALGQSSPTEQGRLLTLLKEAESSLSKQEKTRAVLSSKGVGRFTAFLIELYCERARKSLNLAAPRKPYRERLGAYIDKASLFGAAQGL
ncbi:MAG: polyprenyl synthetase family protein [Elusimicrobia bacterium]|nr:polyprenyl synthetase family protein [Elusimicrobiota bacterium]